MIATDNLDAANAERCRKLLASWEEGGKIDTALTYKLLKLYGYPQDKLTEFAHYNSGRLS